MKRSTQIVSFAKSIVLLLCVIIALASKQFDTNTFQEKQSDKEKSEQTSVQQSVSLEATIPFHKINFDINFETVKPLIISVIPDIKPTIIGFLPTFLIFREIILSCMPSMAP